MPTLPLERLRRIPASDVKKRGWRGVMRALHQQGAVLVTNHAEPEAVVIPVKQYTALLEAAGQQEARAASELAALRSSFDERLSSLRHRGAGDRLRKAMKGPARLGGKVKAGTGY